jgi:hypothetical protein
MISKPIIPVEIKIVSIIKTLEKQGSASLEDLLINESSLPDLIAGFLGVLELIKVRKLLIADDIDETNALLDSSTRFILNDSADTEDGGEYSIATEGADISEI